jgi:hypothetical protein
MKDVKEEYGLMIGQAIQYEWFKKDGNQCRFYNQWRDFNRLRLYARGEQNIGKYKNELAIDGDLSYLNLDWTPVPILPKFVDIVVNGMSERLFKVKAYAQDALSQRARWWPSLCLNSSSRRRVSTRSPWTRRTSRPATRS